MSDLIETERGHLPWRPNADARVELELHRYDHPLMGVLTQGGGAHYFERLVVAGALSVWVYVRIEPAEFEHLASDDSDLRALIAEFVTSRPCVLALAVDDDGIVADTVVGDLRDAGDAVEELVQRFKQYRERLNSATGAEGELQSQVRSLSFA